MYIVFLLSIWAKASLTAQQNLVFLILKILNAGRPLTPALWIQGQSCQQSKFKDSQGYKDKAPLEKPKQTAKRCWLAGPVTQLCSPARSEKKLWDKLELWPETLTQRPKNKKDGTIKKMEDVFIITLRVHGPDFQSWELTKVFLIHARQALYHWSTAQCFRVSLT